MIYKILILLIFLFGRAFATDFVSGEEFRKIANHTYKDANDYKCYLPDPEIVKKGDIIFVSRCWLDNFFKNCHPKIKNKYILITHHNDMGIIEDLRKYLDDDKIFAWFAQNVAIKHPKLFQIPIGLKNKSWKSPAQEIILELSKKKLEKKDLLSANFTIYTNAGVRQKVYDAIKDFKFCNVTTKRKEIKDYLIDVAQSKFIISPHGSGLDCYRTWEALYLNTYPVVKKSSLDPLYKDLPVLIVDDWNQITEEFLNKKYKEFQNKKFNLKRLKFDYWKKLILKQQSKCRQP